MSLSNLLAAVSRPRLVDLLMRAVEVYSPSNTEGPATRVFAEALRAAGLPVRRVPVPGVAEDETRANLVVHLGPEPTALHLVGHVDTIDLGFEYELGIRRDGDLLYGLGTADMKSGCAAMVEALTAVLASGVRLERGVRLSLVVGEEDYGDGAEALVDEELVSDVPLTVIGEPTGLVACTEHYGYLEYRLAGEGTRAHAALPEHGANAIHATLEWITEVLGRMHDLPAAERTAVSLREIRGGTSLFVVPDACEVLIDAHVPHDGDVDALESRIEVLRAEVERNHPGCRLEGERLLWAEGFREGTDDPRLAALARAFEAVGLPYAPGVFRSHSDGNLLHAAGTATVICGPGNLAVAHTEREHVSLDETVRAARLYAALIHAACTTVSDTHNSDTHN